MNTVVIAENVGCHTDLRPPPIEDRTAIDRAAATLSADQQPRQCATASTHRW